MCGVGTYVYHTIQDKPAAPAVKTPLATVTSIPGQAISTPTRPAKTPLPSATPAATAPQIGETSTEALLKAMDVPPNDPIDLAARLRPELGEVSRVARTTPVNYEEGDVIPFWVSNSDNDENWQINAELVVKGKHVYMWREVGSRVKEKDLRKAAKFFDEQIYPTDREFFGSEWSPGIDGDTRLHVLHARNLGQTIAGYFSSADEIPSVIHPYSNEKEMFYLNVDNNKPGTTFYNGTLAHEFQHMIHWHQDLNETTWLNEGASELAMELNGLERNDNGSRPDSVFAANPDVQLDSWPDTDESYPHYGNAYLFLSYFLSRFGEEATKALIADPNNGLESIGDVLQQVDPGTSVDDFFADWVIANWLDDSSIGDGRWGYPNYRIDEMAPVKRFHSLPASESDDVHQYAADYYTLPPSSDAITITFDGDARTRLAATDAHSGQWAWWSNRVDESDSRLTFPLDLSDTTTATLHFYTWYDLESLWDYAYLEVSENDGRSWKMLETPRTTRDNPNGNAYGPGYTGKSDDADAAWVEEQVDLSDYAGKDILVRFEYVTDAAVTEPGMFIDDVSVPEIGYSQDFESGAGDWQSEGWLLTNNRLTERWLVQVLEPASSGDIKVHRMTVADDGHGELQLSGIHTHKDLTLIVSALAPVTVETASYHFSITPAPDN